MSQIRGAEVRWSTREIKRLKMNEHLLALQPKTALHQYAHGAYYTNDT